MSISQSRLSYQDCYDFLDRALDDSKGARVFQGAKDDATFFRMRCHTARQINRRDNEKIYKPGEPLHGASIYDKVSLRIREDEEGNFWVYAEKTEIDPGAIESLSALGD